jgi:astacin
MPGAEIYFAQHLSDGDDVGPYDYESVMHFPADAFSKNGQPTIEPLTAGVSIGQRKGPSKGDVKKIEALYA